MHRFCATALSAALRQRPRAWVRTLAAAPHASSARAAAATAGAPAAVHCSGCGALLQHEHERGVGYCPPQALERPKPVCHRCYVMVNNGRLAPAEVPASTFKSFLRRLYPQQCLIVKVIDIFDFHNSFIPTIASLVGRHKPIVLIVNKRDLLPAATSPTRVIKWVRSAANEMELHNIVDVHFVSSKTGQGVPEAFAAIQVRGNATSRSVCVCACARAIAHMLRVPLPPCLLRACCLAAATPR